MPPPPLWHVSKNSCDLIAGPFSFLKENVLGGLSQRQTYFICFQFRAHSKDTGFKFNKYYLEFFPLKTILRQHLSQMSRFVTPDYHHHHHIQHHDKQDIELITVSKYDLNPSNWNTVLIDMLRFPQLRRRMTLKTQIYRSISLIFCGAEENYLQFTLTANKIWETHGNSDSKAPKLQYLVLNTNIWTGKFGCHDFQWEFQWKNVCDRQTKIEEIHVEDPSLRNSPKGEEAARESADIRHQSGARRFK